MGFGSADVGHRNLEGHKRASADRNPSSCFVLYFTEINILSWVNTSVLRSRNLSYAFSYMSSGQAVGANEVQVKLSMCAPKEGK